MMMLADYAATLEGLNRKTRLRCLAPQRGIDFTSNDFLALADAPRLKAALISAMERGVPVGAGGSACCGAIIPNMKPWSWKLPHSLVRSAPFILAAAIWLMSHSSPPYHGEKT